VFFDLSELKRGNEIRPGQLPHYLSKRECCY